MAKNDEMDSQLVPTILYQVQKNEEMDSQLEIICNPNGENNRNSDQPPSGQSIPQPASVDAPEKKLTLFAQRLAIIEKTTSSLGQLAFIWANVILLGGFTSNLKPIDFWFVTAILVIKGTCLITHTALRGLSVFQPSPCLAYKMQTKQTCLPADAPLYWLQIFASAACVALSLMRVGQQDYGDEAQINEKSALNVFYCLVLTEVLMFLFGKGYWTWTIKHKKLVERVREDCKDLIDMVYLRHFIYDAYSQYINSSNFNRLKMNLVSFANKLLHSDSSDEQIIGATILQRFIETPQFAADTLCKIGSSTQIIEQLIKMLNWKDPAEQYIRRSASEIISKLVSTEQHARLVAAIPGAIESIASLLHTGGDSTDGRLYEASLTAVDYEFDAFKLLGLLILKRLARCHDNCEKIGNARGLLAEIIDLTSATKVLLCGERAPESQIKIVRRALQVLKNLVCATGQAGKILRKDISEIMYTVRNISKLLQYGKKHLKLQMLGLQILKCLAMNEEGRKKIEATEDMLRAIFEVFFQPIEIETEEMGRVCDEAGETLAMLLLDSEKNCLRFLWVRNDVVGRLVDALDNLRLRVNAARILRGLCAYFDPKRFARDYRIQIVAIMPMVLKTILEENENEKLLEALIGLAIQILEKYINAQQFENEIERAGIRDEEFVRKLVEILRRYGNPESKVPNMRRFVIELAVALMGYKDKYIELVRDLGMADVLIRTAETTNESKFLSLLLETGQLAFAEENKILMLSRKKDENLMMFILLIGNIRSLRRKKSIS